MMKKSVIQLIVSEIKNALCKLMQFVVTRNGFHAAVIGVHLKMARMKVARNHATVRNKSIDQAILKFLLTLKMR